MGSSGGSANYSTQTENQNARLPRTWR